MSLLLTKLGRDVFAGHDAAGNVRKVPNGEAVRWATEMERGVASAEAGRVDAVTWADLSEIEGTRAGQPAQVLGPDAGTHVDPVVGGVVANTGTYIWSTSPEGWRHAGALPTTLIHAANEGGGTADAVQATTEVPIEATPYSTLITVNFTDTNTGPMTLSINGETPRDLVLNVGAVIPAGYVQDGMSALVQIDDDDNYRLFSYGDASSVQAAAEAALADLLQRYLGAYADDAAATAAAGTPATGQLYWNTSDDVLKSWNGDGWVSAIQAAGNITHGSATGDGSETEFELPEDAETTNTKIFVDGRWIRSGYTLSAGALVFDEAIGNGVPIDWEVIEIVPLGATTASLTSLGDAGGYFDSNTVEGALQEVGDRLLAAGGFVSPEQYGAVGDGVTDDTAALQDMFDSISAGAVIFLGGKTYKYVGLTIETSCDLWKGHLASDTDDAVQITVDKAARVQFFDVELSGGGDRSTAVLGHNIIQQTGTSRTDRAAGMAFYRCNIHGAGYAAILSRWGDDVVIQDSSIGDCAYACVAMESPRRFRARGNVIDMLDSVGIASSGGAFNAYGIYVSHDSAGYSSDPNAGTPLANNHFGIDTIVDGNTFYGPQVWEALDYHGAYQASYINNRIYGAKIGITAGSSSGDAAAYAGWDNVIMGNIIDTRLPDGTLPDDLVTQAGIVCQGGSTVGQQNYIVANNIIRGYGTAAAGSASVSIYIAHIADRLQIIGNVIDFWIGRAIHLVGAGGVTNISDNIFSDMQGSSGSTSSCLWIDSFTSRMMVMGNIYKTGTNNPAIGMRLGTSVTGVVTYASDFSGVTDNEIVALGGTLRQYAFAA